MSKLITKLLPTQPKHLVCKLLGSLGTKTVDFQRDSDVEKLQRQIKKQFGTKAKARDLKLFPAVIKHSDHWPPVGVKKQSDRWIDLNDKVLDALSKGEMPKAIEELLHRSSEIGFHTNLRKLFDGAPHEGVVHILAKECPVHRVRAARWKTINNTLEDQFPAWIVPQHDFPPPPEEWHKLYEDAYAPQLKPYKENVAPVDAKTLDELVCSLTQSPGVEMNDMERKLCVMNMINSCTDDHRDLTLASRNPLDGYRVDYHVYAPCVVAYKRVPKLVVEPNCDDIAKNVARVLTACEVVADNNDSHEVCGAAVTKDNRWIFLRSLDTKILIDDDAENRLEWDADGTPNREQLTKIVGKLHGMIMENVPAGDPDWREKEEEEWRRAVEEATGDQDEEDDDGEQ